MRFYYLGCVKMSITIRQIRIVRHFYSDFNIRKEKNEIIDFDINFERKS
jgi:hypothetical protein